MSRSTGALLFAGALLAQAPLAFTSAALTSAHAQQSGGWFVPKSSQPAADTAPAAHRRTGTPEARPTPVAVPQPEPLQDDSQGGGQGQAQGPQVQPVLPLPPIPTLAELPKGAPPPAAVFGLISVPDVMRQSFAAQQVEKVLGARRDKLNQEAQKEQASWRDTQQQIQAAKGLSNEQLQGRVHALQARVQAAQKDFRNRNRIIQDAAQVAIGQIERELVQVIKQVAASHGMNFVLHREQVALNMPEFDVTPQVVNQLNTTLPAVFIPADGVDPEQLAKTGTYPTTANPGATPVAAPAPAPATAPAPAPAAATKK